MHAVFTPQKIMTVLASKKKNKYYSEEGSPGVLGRGEVSHLWFRIHRKLRVPQDVCPVRAIPGEPGPRVGVVMNGRMT